MRSSNDSATGDGAWRTRFPSGASEAFARRLESELSELGIEATSTQGAFVVEAWAGIVGCISMEVFGQLGPGLEGFGLEVTGRMIDSLAERLADPST